jgi:ribosome-associated translation inhibitor RaiA
MYELHVKDLFETEALKQLADHTVKEIKSTTDWDTEVQITVEPEAKDKKLFSVSMSVYGLHEPVVVRKEGKNVLAVFRKVKKTALRQIHRMNERRITARRKLFFKEQYAS